MISREKLQAALARYKEYFPIHWKDENFKWKAVKCFQDNWNVNANDFPEMLRNSLAQTESLLVNANNFPKSMITGFSDDAPEDVRAMFIELYDETRDLSERFSNFKARSEEMLRLYGGNAINHYQSENVISVYLWLRYPDKYFMYKYGEIKTIAEKLESDYRFVKGHYADNIQNFMALYGEICAEIQQDEELKALFKSKWTEEFYKDPELHTLTNDVGFYISRFFEEEDASEVNEPKAELRVDDSRKLRYWIYSPGDGAANWDEFYDAGIMALGWDYLGDLNQFNSKDEMRQKMQETLDDRQSHKNDALATWQFAHDVKPGDIVFVKKGLYQLIGQGVVESDYYFDSVRERYKHSRKVKWTHKGEWDFPGVAPMKTLTDITKDSDLIQKLNALLEGKTAENNEITKEPQGYWFLNANPKIWSMSSMAVGEEQDYTLYNENGNKRRIFQNFLNAKAGDLVIGYESTPVKQVVAILQISKEQDGERINFKKLEGLSTPIDFAMLKSCPELENMEYLQNQQGSLFKLTSEEYDAIMDMIREENTAPIKTDSAEDYDKEKFLTEVYMTESKYNRLAAVLKKKKNIILQGAPGVGKTFAAKRLAYSIMGEKDDSRIEFVQFHQNYSYEDFVMGYKPVENGFELKYGIFYRFCQKASNQPDKDFFFIIDEINRGNMSKIFGELLMLIEADYRDTKITLAYNGLSFVVPKNLHIIGMMNTADRSLAMIDYALRRRFSFFDIEPGFDSEGFRQYQKSLNNETFDQLIDRVKDLNRKIAQDNSLGKGFCIGHSYFCNLPECTDVSMMDIIDFDILPMLSEYWFDDAETLQRWESALHGVFQ